MSRISLSVNGKPQNVDIDRESALLCVLRHDPQLTGTEFGLRTAVQETPR